MCINIQAIIRLLNEIAPENIAEEWDNVGALVLNEKLFVNDILLAVELSESVIDEAIEREIDLIITHHPIMFKKINKISTSQNDGKKIIRLIENEIQLYSLHTNYDQIDEGTSYAMAERLRLVDIVRIGEYAFAGELFKSMTMETLLKYVKEIFNIETVKVIGHKDVIRNIGTCAGAGFEAIMNTDHNTVDVYLTGEIKYHEAVELHEKGYTVIMVGHFESERPAMEKLSLTLQKRTNELKYNLRVYLSENDFSPIVFR